MEIFGSTFDDSVFSEARDRVCVSLSSYKAKLCEPEVRVSVQYKPHSLIFVITAEKDPQDNGRY